MTTSVVPAGDTLSGTTLFNAGGSSVGTIVLSAGVTLLVTSGATVENLTVTAGETISVFKSGTTFGTANNVSVAAGGSVYFSSGALVNTTVLSGGTLQELTLMPNDTGLYVQSGGTLAIGTVSGAAVPTTSQTAPIGYDSGAVIEVLGVPSTATPMVSHPTASTTELLVSAGGVQHEAVFFSGSATFTSSATTFTSGSGTVTDWVFTVITCFAEGTNILTPDGDRKIEAIKPGDLLTVLRNGEQVQEAVKWVGYSKIDLSRHARTELAAPVRVKAGALGENTPARDLVLSPEHCLVIDNRCIPVKLLANGASIAREFPAEPFTYYHIELDNHGILIAEGAQSESYLDTGNRASFDNAETPRVLHPTFTVNANAARWATDACAPLAKVPDEVAPVWQALAERAVELGMAIPTPVLVENPDLHLIVDGKRVQPTSDRNSRFVFMVPAGAKSVTLASRFCIPADKMVPGVRDTRRLGVSVDWMAIRTTTTETILSADHPALIAGWNDVEHDGATMWRWTDGAATIPWENVAGSAVLTVRCTPVSQYPIYDEKLRLVA